MLFGPNMLPFGLEMLHFGLCLLFSGLEACCLLAWRRRLPAPERVAFCPGDVAFWPHICHLLAWSCCLLALSSCLQAWRHCFLVLPKVAVVPERYRNFCDAASGSKSAMGLLLLPRNRSKAVFYTQTSLLPQTDQTVSSTAFMQRTLPLSPLHLPTCSPIIKGQKTGVSTQLSRTCRQTFWEQYSTAANDAAQALAQRRSKEATMRDVFKRAVSRLIPAQVCLIN